MSFTNWLRRIKANLQPHRGRNSRRGLRKTPTFRPTLERLEDRVTPAVRVWDGGSLTDALWTTPANWVGDVAPAALGGDQLEFPSVAARKTNQNNFGAGTGFEKITFSGNGYLLLGNKITLGSLGILDTSLNATGSGNTVQLDMTLSGSTQNITVNSSSETLFLSGILDGGASMLKLGAGTVSLFGTNTYAGMTTVNDGILRLFRDTALGSTAAGTVVATGATLELGFGISVGGEALTLNGVGFSGLGALRTLGDNFAASWAGNITLASNTKVQVDHGGSSHLLQLTLSGIVSGPGDLTKLGSGNLVLTGANTYTGKTIIDQGILNIRNSSALGGTTAGTEVNGSASLELEGGILVGAESLSLPGQAVLDPLKSVSGDNSWAGPVVLRISGALTPLAVESGQLTISGVISGPGGFQTTRSGKLVLTGANTYSGLTDVIVGVLNIQNSSALGSTSSGTVVVSFGTLEVEGGLTVAGESLSVSNSRILRSLGGANSWSGGITLSGNDRVEVDSASSLVLSGVVGGNISSQLTKAGLGTLELKGANTYAGLTTVAEGTMRVSNAQALGTDTVETQVLNGATLQVVGSLAVNEPLTLNGPGAGNAGVLVSESGANTFSGAIALAGDATMSVQVDNSLNLNQLTLSGAIVGGGFGITKVGQGPLQLTGATSNSYTGTTTVKDGSLVLAKSLATAIAGPLVLAAADGSFGVSVILNANDQIADTAPVTLNHGSGPFSTSVLALNNSSDQIGSLTLAGGSVTTGAGTLGLRGGVSQDSPFGANITGKLDLGSVTRAFTVTTGSVLTIDAVVSGAAGAGLSKFGLGTLQLSGANTYTGLTLINAGVVTITRASALGTPTQGTTVVSGATLSFFSPIVVDEPLTLSGSGVGGLGALQVGRVFAGTPTWAGPIVLASNASIGVANLGKLTVTGVVSGPFGLTKVDVGTLQFAGGAGNLYAGTTTVAAGTLELNASAGAAVPGNLIIGDGVGNATDKVVLLAGNQIADAGAVTLNSTGTLDLLNQLEAIGPLTMNSGAITTGTGILTLTGDVVVNAVAASAAIQGFLNLAGATRTFTVADTIADPQVAELSIAAPIMGNAGFTKQGAGLMELSGASTFTGTTTIAAGQVTIRTATALGASAGPTVVLDSAKLLFGGSGGASIIVNEPLVLGGTLESGPATQTWSGAISLNGSPLLQVAAGNTMLLTGSVSGAGNMTKQGAGTTVYGGATANNQSGSTLVKEGTLLLNKAGFPAVAGPLLVGDGTANATVRLNVGNQISDTAPVTLTSTPGFSAVLDLNNNSDNIGSLTMTGSDITTGFGAGILGVGGNVTTNASTLPATITGTLSLGVATRTFTVAEGGVAPDLIVNATVVGPTGVGLTKAGPGSMRLAGSINNNYSGVTTVNDGILLLAKAPNIEAIRGPLVIGDGVGIDQVVDEAPEQINNGVPTSVNSSGILDLTPLAIGLGENIGPLTMSGGLITTGAAVLTLCNDVTVTASGASAVINGNLSLNTATWVFTVADGAAPVDLVINALVSAKVPGVGVIKSGAGVMQLTANNTYSGSTTVNAGALLIDGTQQSSPVQVNSTATLGGKGSAGVVTFLGGTLDPGSPIGSPGVFSFAGGLALPGASTLQVQLNGPAINGLQDQVNVLGLVNIDGSSLAIGLGFVPNPGDRFLLIQNDAADAVIGTFAGLAEGAVFQVIRDQYQITYAGGDGNDVVLTYLNTAPMIADVTLTPSLDEGGNATLTGRLVDPNAGDLLKLQVNWGDRSPVTNIFPGLTPFSLNHLYLNAGNFLVHFVWSDNRGGSNERTLPVTVHNVAPKLTELSATADGRDATLSGTIVDPGVQDTFRLVVDWGDGTSETFAFVAGTTTFQVKHQYLKPGNRKIHMVLADDDGGTDTAEVRVKV